MSDIEKFQDKILKEYGVTRKFLYNKYKFVNSINARILYCNECPLYKKGNCIYEYNLYYKENTAGYCLWRYLPKKVKK